MNRIFTLLLLVGMMTVELSAQVCADFCYDPCEFAVPCSPVEPYEYIPCIYDLEECAWECTGDGPNRPYIGPVYYYRRTDFTLDGCTNVNVFGLTGNTKSKGQFVGVNFGYEFREICCWYFRADAVWSSGTQRPCPRIRLNDWQAEGRVGYTWGECVPAGYAVSPYAGIGYIWQNRRFGRIGFKGDYQTWYVPLGIYADVEVMCGFTAGVDFTFAPFFSTNIRAFRGDTAFHRTHESRNRYMWRVAVPFRYQVMCACGFEVSVEPFWEQFNFGRICNTKDAHDRIILPGVPHFRENLWGAKFLAAYKF